MDQSRGRRAFFFVLVLVLVTALAMGAVLALNVVADPYGSVGTHLFPTVTTSDRTVKADKIEQLKEPPDLVVLGSSRSMRYEPAYLEEKTGLQDLQRGRQRHRRDRRRVGDDAVHPRGVAGRGPRIPVARGRRVLRPLRGRCPHRQRAAPGSVRGPGDDRKRSSGVRTRPVGEPHHAAVARHGQGLRAPAPLPREGQEQAEQVPQADPGRWRAQAAQVEREGVGPPLPQLRRALQQPVQERLQEDGPRRRGVLREDARLHERAGRDAARRAHAHQPQAQEGPGTAGLGRAPRAGRRLHRVPAGRLRRSSSST